MARWMTAGAEMQTTANGSEALNFGGVNTNIVTTSPRSGAACYTISGTDVGFPGIYEGVTSTTGTNWWARGWFKLTSLPTTIPITLIGASSSGNYAVAIRVETNGSVTTWNDYSVVQNNAGLVVTPNTWFCLEAYWNVVAGSAGSIEGRLNGATIYGSNGNVNTGTTAVDNVVFGKGVSGNPGITTVSIDDLAINDSTGAAQNSWCGITGKVVLLKPISNNTNTGFAVSHVGDNLWASVGAPPLGTAIGDTTTVNSKIKDATNNATDNYITNVAAYTTAVASGGGGMAASDTVDLCYPVAIQAQSVTTSINNGVSSTNPTVVEITNPTGTTAAGTYPTGWTTLYGTTQYSPTVTLGSSPTVTFRRGAGAVSAFTCLMGVVVEYETPPTEFISVVN